MSHTEEQARELWCPMVRIARHEVVHRETGRAGDLVAISEDHHIVGGCNTDALGVMRVPASCRCIASKCAMWVWEPSEDGLVYAGIKLVKTESGRVEEHPQYEPATPTRGYCGLARER